MPERSYAHRSLLDKLGVKPEHRVALSGNVDRGFATTLAARLAAPATRSLRAAYDIVFLQVDAPSDLDRIAIAARHLVANGALWVFHPKGKGAAVSDSAVRDAGLTAGLVDNKISAYTQTHTATRYVIPVARRR